MRFVVRLATDKEIEYGTNTRAVPILLDTAIEALEVIIYLNGTNEDFKYWWIMFDFSQSLAKELLRLGKTARVPWMRLFDYICNVVPLKET